MKKQNKKRNNLLIKYTIMTQIELETLTAVKKAANEITFNLPLIVKELNQLNKTLQQFLDL